MDSTAIKLEPGTSAEEGVAVILTEINIEYPFIKNKCSESISENSSGEVSTTDHSYLEGITTKVESGTKEEFCEIPFSETGIELPDIIKEALEHSQSIIQPAGIESIPLTFRGFATDLLNPEIGSIKTDPGPQEEGGREISYADIDFDLPGVKKGCIQYEESHRKVGSIKVERLSFKVESGPREVDGEVIPCMEIGRELPDVKKECLKRFQRITQPEESLTNLKTHYVGKPISCSHCNYSCFYKSKLEHHLRTHTGEKPFSCSDCSYSCSQKSRLTVHMRIHSREKPFSCSDCSYSCFQKGNLTRHMLTHGREKPFSCPNCSYACTQKDYLTKHMRSHSGEKPFSCSDCKYSCYLKQSLTRHMLTHSGEKPFSCSDCKYVCSRKESLTRHMRTHSRV